MRIPLPAAKKRARIEIIPLIDIVFFLLATFVMVSLSMVKNQGVIVKLPAAQTGAPQERKFFTTISVTEDGSLFLDKESIAREMLSARLQQLKASNPDARIFINGDEKAAFGDAISILDQVRAAGIEKVTVQTKGKGK